MRTLLLAGTAAMTSLALIVLTVLRDMLSQEVRVRIERLPFAVLRLAARQIPADLRDTICRDWEAELAYVLSNEAGAGPITRLIVANKWALSMLLLQGGRQTAKELHAYEPPELKGFEDIRQLPRSERRRFVTLTARLKDLCSGPVDIFTENALVRLVNAVSVACEARATSKSRV